MFAVVKWDSCSEASVVPTSWLAESDGEYYSYWPTTSGSDRDGAVKQMTVPHVDWQKFPVRVLQQEGMFCTKPSCLIQYMLPNAGNSNNNNKTKTCLAPSFPGQPAPER